MGKMGEMGELGRLHSGQMTNDNYPQYGKFNPTLTSEAS